MPLGDFVGRQRISDPHGLGDILSRRQPEQDAALEIAERQAAAATRQRVQGRDDERIDLARGVECHT